MSKRESTEANSPMPSKKLKTPSRDPTDLDTTGLDPLVANANASNKLWRMRLVNLVEEKTELESRNWKEPERLIEESERNTKAEDAKNCEEKEMAYIVYSTWYEAYDEPRKEFEGLYYDLDTANKAALIAYKKLYPDDDPDFDWRERPITDFGTTSTLDKCNIRDDEAGRVTSPAGAHGYKIEFGQESATVTVEPCGFWSAATIHRREDKDSDLPWKRAQQSHASSSAFRWGQL